MNREQGSPGAPRARRSALVASALLLAVASLLAACSGSGGSAPAGMTPGEPMPADAAVTMEYGPGGMPGEANEAAVTAEQQVIRTASVSLRVDDVAGAGTQIVALVSESKGFIQMQDLSNSGEATYETITARVPADRLDAFLAEIARLGTVENLSSQASDVTQQTVDLEARIGALTTSVERLQELLAATGNVADLVAVEAELANRQAELDSLVSQRDYLADQVAYSTVTLSLTPVVEAIGVTPPGFWSGLQNGWTTLTTLAGAAITALGFLIPFILLSAVIAVPIIIAVSAASRRRRRASLASTDVPPSSTGSNPGTT
jgi:hypothetical protein